MKISFISLWTDSICKPCFYWINDGEEPQVGESRWMMDACLCFVHNGYVLFQTIFPNLEIYSVTAISSCLDWNDVYDVGPKVNGEIHLPNPGSFGPRVWVSADEFPRIFKNTWLNPWWATTEIWQDYSTYPIIRLRRLLLVMMDGELF